MNPLEKLRLLVLQETDVELSDEELLGGLASLHDMMIAFSEGRLTDADLDASADRGAVLAAKWKGRRVKMNPLVIRRKPNETWREATKRIASQYGLERECLENFDEYTENGAEPENAAFCALYDWDCTDWKPDK